MATSTERTPQRMTAEQFYRDPPPGRSELIEGEVHMMSPAGGRHGRVAGNIFNLLRNYVAQEKLGIVYAAETGFILSRDPDTVRAPDVAFVRRERVDEPVRGFIPITPDLAVEVVSPDDRIADVMDKAEAFLAAGSISVWLLWPETRSVTVHRPGQPPRVLHESQTLDDEHALPGFSCDVARCFE